MYTQVELSPLTYIMFKHIPDNNFQRNLFYFLSMTPLYQLRFKKYNCVAGASFERDRDRDRHIHRERETGIDTDGDRYTWRQRGTVGHA